MKLTFRNLICKSRSTEFKPRQSAPKTLLMGITIVVTAKETKFTRVQTTPSALLCQVIICEFDGERDNALTTTTTNRGDDFFGVLTFFHVWLHGTLDLSHFRDEQDWNGSTVIRGLGTINSIQLVLISAMERKSGKKKKTTTSQGPPTMKWITHEWKLIKSASFICREY